MQVLTWLEDCSFCIIKLDITVSSLIEVQVVQVVCYSYLHEYPNPLPPVDLPRLPQYATFTVEVSLPSRSIFARR